MGWLSGLFATEKAVDNIIDKEKGLLTQVGNWIGGFNYTDEEKAEADQQTREWGFRQLDALAPFKVVQRIGFFTVSGILIFMVINLVVCQYIDAATITKTVVDGVVVVVPGTNLFDNMYKLATSQFIFWPIAIVYALYYAGGVMPRKGGS